MGMGKRFLLKNDQQFLITPHFVGIDLFPHMNVINAIEAIKVVRVSPNYDVTKKTFWTTKLIFAYCAMLPSALSHSSSNFDFWYPNSISKLGEDARK